MLTREKIRYIIVFILFILYLIFSNTIIAAFKDNNVIKTTVNIEKYKKDIVYYSLSDINCQNDVFDSFDFNGWAFCEAVSNNSNKEVWLILDNDTGTYMHKTELKKRFDVVRAFKDGYSIKGEYHGISGTLSTVGVKNGIYKLYIYCKENEENYGLVDTGIMLKKDGRGISQYIWYSSLCDVSETTGDGNVKYVIDSTSVTGEGYLQINGWAFVEGLDTADQSVYVRLTYDDGTKATYDTQSISRPDVGIAYKSDLYNNSGFKAMIPADKLQDGNIMIEILISNGKNVYLASETYKYSSDISAVEISPDITEEESFSTEAEIDVENITEDITVKYFIDSCSADETLVVKGWAYIEDKESAKTAIYLAVTSADGKTRVYTTTKVSRPDVAEAFDNELYTESGFEAVIPLDAIADGENKVTVITDNELLLKAPSSYIFNYKAEGNN